MKDDIVTVDDFDRRSDEDDGEFVLIDKVTGEVLPFANPNSWADIDKLEQDYLALHPERYAKASKPAKPVTSEIVYDDDDEAERNFQRAGEAIAFIDPTDRGTWRDVGMVLKLETGDDPKAWELFDEWSQEVDPKKLNENRRQWKSFKTNEAGSRLRWGTFFDLARAGGWQDSNTLPIPVAAELPVWPRKAPKRFQKVRDPDGLTERTMIAVRERFAEYGHHPSDKEYEGLEQIALTIEAMADSGTGQMREENGSRSKLAGNYLVSYLAPGTGKTTVIIEAVKVLCQMPAFAEAGVIILLSRLEEIAKLAIAMGLADGDFAVMVSKDKDENLLGRQDDKTKARVLFTTQEGLRTRHKDGTLFAEMERLFFNGKPRQVRLWDEAAEPSRNLTVSRYDISDMFNTFRKWGQSRLADLLEDFFADLKAKKDRDVIVVPDVTQSGLSVDEARNVFTDKPDVRDAVEALFKLSGRTVRIRQDQGNVLLDYDETLPADLAPMLILDASGDFRQTYQFWHQDRGGLEFLPSADKLYNGLTIHHWDRGAGKKKQHADHQKIAEGVARTIGTIPSDDEVLVVHFKPSAYIPDIGPIILDKLPEARKAKVRFLTWGKHTATNDFHHVKHVILAGILQYSVPVNEAILRGAKRSKTEDESSVADFNGTRLGEIAHNIFQAACRGYVRHSFDGSCPPECHLYMIFSTDPTKGVPRELLGKVFPGAKVEDWKPVPELHGPIQRKVSEIFRMPGNFSKAALAETIGTRTDRVTTAIDKDEFRAWLRENNGLEMIIHHSTIALSPGLPF